MKTSLLAALTTFVLFALTTTNPSVVEAQVLDTDGNPVEWSTNYYILPFVWGPLGGGLTLGRHNNSICPLYVTQEPSDLSNGLTVAFSPRISRLSFVTSSADLSIRTTGAAATCKLSLVWKIVPESTRLWFVSTNGNSNSPTSIFKIEHYESYYYKILFCPAQSPIPTLCKGLGIYIDDDGTRYLAIGDDIEPFRFVFKKAEVSQTQNYIKTMV
ncbi:Kunitz trypsin inhibitor [Quillaja saponaria]|uniref:Kunitz trypsin inhibitor n=1 Tax=Quillaja saponaria TaxID=32244 RepID=A0AAD7Q6H5_QUISA|nr:Kunitz trypsin inhibitor [Quillaja saponaria]